MTRQESNVARGDWDSIDLYELFGVVAASAMIGGIRMLYLIRRGRKFRWFDLVLEPALAVLAGVLMWGVIELTDTPDVLQAVLTSLGAWGGPRTIQWLEGRYLGADSKSRETRPADLDGGRM